MEKNKKLDTTIPVVCNFLEDLVYKLKTGDISPDEYLQIGEFYISYKCRGDIKTRDIKPQTVDDEMLKYMFLGYFIYRFLFEKDDSEKDDSEKDDSEKDYIKIDDKIINID